MLSGQTSVVEMALQKAGLMPTPEGEGRMWRLKGFGFRVKGLGLRDVKGFLRMDPWGVLFCCAAKPL